MFIAYTCLKLCNDDLYTYAYVLILFYTFCRIRVYNTRLLNVFGFTSIFVQIKYYIIQYCIPNSYAFV